MIFFTSDEHIGHKNILKHEPRPFSSLEEMTDGLVEAHNSVVKQGDSVYHLGDLAWKYPYYGGYIRRLNGQHFLLVGNHDNSASVKKLANDGIFGWIKDTYRLKYNGNIFWLSHYPHISWPSSNYGSIHLFGHCHGKLAENRPNSMDVGVDTREDYRPYSIYEVMNILS